MLLESPQASFVKTDFWYDDNFWFYTLRTASETGTMRFTLIYKFYIISNVFIGGYTIFQKPSFNYKLLGKESSQVSFFKNLFTPVKNQMESIIENISHSKINEIYLLNACKVHLFHRPSSKIKPLRTLELNFFFLDLWIQDKVIYRNLSWK